MQALAEFIARQLNDHKQSKRGARQGTFHTWSEPHIKEAIDIALSYLFSILPSIFAEIKETVLPEESCDIEFKCCKVLDIFGIGECSNVSIQESPSTNNLLSMLCTPCASTGFISSYVLTRLTSNIFTSATPIPAGVAIRYLCAEKPDDCKEADDCILDEHATLITAFALWWLLLTDNESRTNLERAQLYYQTVKDYVELKLLLEFSLNEDDYKYGRRVVND